MTEAHQKQPDRAASRVKRVLGTVLVTVLIAVGLVRTTGCAERFAYFPSRQPFETPPNFQDVWFESADGVRLHAWFMPAVVEPGQPAPSEPGPAVLHAHGNAGTLADHLSFSESLTREGFHVLLFDYRGYGRSDDAPPLRRNKLLLDTQAAFDTLITRPEVDPNRVGVMGVSLGGAFAAQLAADDERVRALTLVSAFSSWRGVASDWIPVLGPLLIKRGLDPKNAVTELADRPLLIVHGQADQVINARHATLLEAAANQAAVPVTLRVVPGADHNSLIQTDPSTRDAIAEFFSQALANP